MESTAVSARPPKVVFFAHTGEPSGPTHSLIHLLRELRDDFRFAVVAPSRGSLEPAALELGCQFVLMPWMGRRAVPEMIGVIRRLGADVVYGNTPQGSARNALVAAKLAGRPFVWHFRGVRDDWSWRQGVLVRLADAVIAVSQACARPLVRFRGDRRVHVIYNGVDLETFAPPTPEQRSAAREELGLPEDALVLLTLSHVMPRKGVQFGLEAVLRQTQGANLYWLIAGALDRDPAYVAEVRSRIGAAGSADRIRLLGLRADVPRLVAAADLFLHPSLDDAHPRAVLEAMAGGLAVVGFAVGGVAETVVDGETGRLAPAGDVAALVQALQETIADGERRRRWGEQARARVLRDFSAEQTARRVREVILSVL